MRKYFLFFSLTETTIATISCYLIFFFWSVNYANLVHKFSLNFGSVKIHKYSLYWKVFIETSYIDVYRNVFFNCLLFFIYICWSANSIVELVKSKFHNFFLTCSETEARFIFESFKYCLLWKVHFQLSDTFLAFFICSANCSRDFLSHFVGQ